MPCPVLVAPAWLSLIVVLVAGPVSPSMPPAPAIPDATIEVSAGRASDRLGPLAENGRSSSVATALVSRAVNPATPGRPVRPGRPGRPVTPGRPTRSARAPDRVEVSGLAVVPTEGRPVVSTPVPEPVAIARLSRTLLSLIPVAAPIAPPAAWA